MYQFGKGLLWAEGENHRRQRKALAPAFTNAAIRRLTSVFFDSAYKVNVSVSSIYALKIRTAYSLESIGMS